MPDDAPPESDPLAETAAAMPVGVITATGTPSVPAAQAPGAPGVPTSLGRYTIDGVLGSGAMGIVYAARDPDLDRRIALKVLRGADSSAARARLLREARAMARLSHPNVVTVHEVGTADGVDYVAMELIDGTTVAEWARGTPREAGEVLETFDAAGKGLAAAHAAGLVHRDFKPHNILRSKRGRVVVTDFGLARAALDEPEAAGGQGGAPDQQVDSASLSSTLTATGALLGTPAYMAPEQHDHAGVGPAADQFAFCVALWEALAGARPFPGHTMGEVRKQIERGPDPATEAKVPRRLRGALRRGLAVDPRRRYPTMEALLAAIRPRRRAPWLLAAIAAAAAVGIAAIVASSGETVVIYPGCGDADAELAAFRAAPARAALVATPIGAEHVAALDRIAGDWREAQRAVCANQADPELRRRATCLAAARTELEVALAATAKLEPAHLADADPVMLVGDPLACKAARPPNRVATGDPREIEIAALSMMPEEDRTTVPDPGVGQPCLRAAWRLANLRGRSNAHADTMADLAAAAEEVGRCGDDRSGALVTIWTVSLGGRGMVRSPDEADRLRGAAERAGGDRVVHAIATLMNAARTLIDGDSGEFIALAEPGIEAAIAIGCWRITGEFGALLADHYLKRDAAGDRDRARALVERHLPRVGPSGRAVLLRALYDIELQSGRLAEAHAAAARIEDPPMQTPANAITLAGRVVDAAGKPVAGARVVTQDRLYADATMIAPTARKDRVATSGADGTFSIPAVAPFWVVMAEHTGRRSLAVPVGANVDLVLRPTGAVAGKVTRATEGLGQLQLAATPLDRNGSLLEKLAVVAPVAADGSFRIEGIPHGRVRVNLEFGPFRRRSMRSVDVTIGAAPAAPVELEAAIRGDRLHVVVRSQAESELSAVLVAVVRGRSEAKTLGEILKRGGDLRINQGGPTRREEAPPATQGVFRAGDAVVTFEGVEAGEVTACAFGIAGNIMDPRYIQRINQHVLVLDVGCTTLAASGPDPVVVVEVPPMKRLPDL